MDWDEIRFFLAVARTRSIRSAAKQLGVNHATVSRRIRALEQRRRARLFERLPQGFELTSIGREVLQMAESIDAQMAAIHQRLQGCDDELAGDVRLTVSDGLLPPIMPALNQFQQNYPQVRIVLHVDNESVSMTKREADIALRLTSQPPEHLVGRRIGSMPVALYGSDELLQRYPNGEPEQLPWIDWSQKWQHLPSSEVIQQQGHGGNVVCQVNTPSAMLEATKAGMGLSWLMCCSADLAPNLQRLSPPQHHPMTELWLLTHPDLRTTRRIQLLMENLSDQLRPLTQK